MLGEVGIDVENSNCGLITGMAVTTVCGAQTLDINLHEISSKDLEQAQELGFQSVDRLSDEGLSYTSTNCE